MRMDQAIVDRMDRVLIAKYAILDEFMIKSLNEMNLGGIYISEGEITLEEKQKEEPTSAIAKNNISKFHEDDRARVKLSESVKKRISEGVQYLYNNPASPEFSKASNHITNDLMKAITDNEAVAVDISALRASDEYTFKHSVDVATMSMIIAKKMGYSRDEIYEIGISGLLHDMGKSKIPLEVLNKPGGLSEEEFEVMKTHALLGYRILQEKEEFSEAVKFGVLQHHEKMNGKGYPMGVTGDKIHKYAKIMSVADVYDALVTERPYKKAFSQRTAVEMIMSMTDELDIDAMKAFLASVILYPVDTVVELSNGERAWVVKNNPNTALRPLVVGTETGNVYDLSDDITCANIVIL
ncbi:MAG: HD-GYP domain-containing protein [Lachnospiraceae bacterium]|nr:HD-GYP domain-containing protein [Lachnospiraceae bacterium]